MPRTAWTLGEASHRKQRDRPGRRLPAKPAGDGKAPETLVHLLRTRWGAFLIKMESCGVLDFYESQEQLLDHVSSRGDGLSSRRRGVKTRCRARRSFPSNPSCALRASPGRWTWS